MIDGDTQGEIIFVLLLHQVPEIGLGRLCNRNHGLILDWVIMAARRWRAENCADYASN